MRRSGLGQTATASLHALMGWAFCGATMSIAMAAGPLRTALIIHAAGAPLIFATVSWAYFTRFEFSSPLRTALTFVAVVIFMDVFLVAVVVQGSFAMFRSFVGTWLPFILIFVSTYVTGAFFVSRRKATASRR